MGLAPLFKIVQDSTEDCTGSGAGMFEESICLPVLIGNRFRHVKAQTVKRQLIEPIRRVQERGHRISQLSELLIELVIISLTLNVRISAQEDGTSLHILDRTSRLTTLAQIAGIFLGSPYSSGEQFSRVRWTQGARDRLLLYGNAGGFWEI